MKAVTYTLFTAFMLFVLAGAYSCRQEDNETIKIGAIFDLTGSLAYMGKWSQNGAILAVDKINNQGGLNNKKVKLIVEDGGSEAAKGVSAFRKLLDSDHVSLVIGFNSSSTVMAVAPIANAKKVVVLSSGTGSPNITNAGDYIFRNRLSGSLEVEAISKFITVNNHQKKIGIVYINNEYGKGYADIFHQFFKKNGGHVLLEEGFEQNQTDFKSLVKKLKDRQIQTIYLVAYAREAGNLLKQAFEQEYTPKWYSANPIEAPEFLQIAGKSGEGIIYSIAKYDPNDLLAKQFNIIYKTKYGHDSEMFAANTYDAVTIGAKAISSTDGSGPAIKSFLYNSVKNYPGVAGLTTFDKNGDVIKPVMMKTIRNGLFVNLK